PHSPPLSPYTTLFRSAVLTPLTLAESTPEYPRLLHTVIDTTVPRRSAEFYRQLLGYIYRPGDEPGSGADSVDPDWLVLTDTRGRSEEHTSELQSRFDL